MGKYNIIVMDKGGTKFLKLSGEEMSFVSEQKDASQFTQIEVDKLIPKIKSNSIKLVGHFPSNLKFKK